MGRLTRTVIAGAVRLYSLRSRCTVEPVMVPLPCSRWRRLVESPVAPVALLVVFAGLIAFMIGRFSVWIDESASLLLVGPNSYSEIYRRTAVDTHPPLWYWVLKPWLDVFGVSVVAARAQSAVFMIAALGVWYHLLRSWFSRSLALLALLLMVTNPMLLHYAVEGRMYAFGVLLVGVGCVLITGHWRWRWLAYWLCAVAMLYTHYFLVFAVAAQFVYLLLRRRDQSLSVLCILIYGASIVVAYVPWLPHALRQTSAIVTGYFWIGPIAPSTVLSYVLHAFLHRFDNDLQNVRIFPGLLYLAAWAAALIRAGRARGGPFALLWCVVAVPWACLFIVSCEPLRPVFHARYVIFGLPALIALLAAGALGLTGRWRTFVIAVLLVGHLAGIDMVRYRGFADWRSYWTMKRIAREVSQPIDGEVPWVVSNWVFTFFDARATLDERQRVVMLASAEPRFISGEIVYYGRRDWYVLSFSEIPAHHVWIIDDAGKPPIDVPPSWKLVVTHARGYARTRLFKTDSP